MTATVVIQRSPYLSSHKEYWGLLSQPADTRFPPAFRESVELYLRSGTAVIWSSGEMIFPDFLYLNANIRHFIRANEKLTFYIRYARLYPTPSRSITVRVPGPVRSLPLGGGRFSTSVNGSDLQYRSAVRKARRVTDQDSPTPWSPRGQSFPRRNVNAKPSPGSITAPFRTVIENIDASGAYTLSVGTASTVLKSWTWSGTVTPGFGGKKASSLPVNPYNERIRLFYENTNVYHTFVPSNGANHTEVLPWTNDLPDPGMQSHNPVARNKAIRKLIDSAELAIDANLAQDFAQISQLTNLISGTCGRFVGSIGDLRRGNIAGAINHLTAGRTRLAMPKGKPNRKKDLAENWLELQYGWKPLLMDIEGLLKSLSNLTIAQPTVRRVVGKGSQERQALSIFDTYSATTIGPRKGKFLYRFKTDCKIGVTFTMYSPMLSFLAQTGFTNPINLVWEILPFSFVADWFIGIGPYLEALSAWDGLTFIDGYQTQFSKMWVSGSVDYDGVNVGNPAGQVFQDARLKLEEVLFERIKLTAFPSMTFPSFKNPLGSVTHAMNGIALIVGIFHGK